MSHKSMLAIFLNLASMRGRRDISIGYSGEQGGHSWGASGSYKDGRPSISGGYGYSSGDGKHKFSVSGDWSRNNYRRFPKGIRVPIRRPPSWHNEYSIDEQENGQGYSLGYSGEQGGHSWGASGSYRDGKTSVSGGYGYTSGDGKHKFSVSGDWSRNYYGPQTGIIHRPTPRPYPIYMGWQYRDPSKIYANAEKK